MEPHAPRSCRRLDRLPPSARLKMRGVMFRCLLPLGYSYAHIWMGRLVVPTSVLAMHFSFLVGETGSLPLTYYLSTLGNPQHPPSIHTCLQKPER